MGDLLGMLYPWTKTFHVIAVIAWMAGLFYLPRLFVHHVERAVGEPAMTETFRMMERKLLTLIMTPAMLASWIFGLMLVLTPGIVDWTAVWPWTKAASVLAMTWFHFWCAGQQKAAAAGAPPLPGRSYRMMNEVPTLLLVIIVVSVIARPF